MRGVAMRWALVSAILVLMGCTHTSVVVTTVVTKVAKGSQEIKGNEFVPDPVEILKHVPEGEKGVREYLGRED
jgi:hypothetical protein